ncbi:MAG: sulfite exporter TauE/SafE family protein [Methanoregula sp.]|jgi:hypothetical protein
MDPLIFSSLILAITGSVIGVASGFFGLGGGFLMIPVQYWLLTSMGVDPTLALRIAFGTSLAVILPTALSSTWGHHCRGCVLLRPLAMMVIPGIIGSFAGAAIAAHAPGRLMAVLFGVLLFLAAVRMFFHIPAGKEPAPCSTGVYLPWGFAFGLVSGLFGIGGGIVMVPVMTTVLGIPLRQAIGTSTAFMLFSSASGIISYVINGLDVAGRPPYSLGYVNVAYWCVLVAASVPFAQLGVRAAHTISPGKIKLLFVILMVGIGLYMILGSG